MQPRLHQVKQNEEQRQRRNSRRNIGQRHHDSVSGGSALSINTVEKNPTAPVISPFIETLHTSQRAIPFTTIVDVDRLENSGSQAPAPAPCSLPSRALHTAQAPTAIQPRPETSTPHQCCTFKNPPCLQLLSLSAPALPAYTNALGALIASTSRRTTSYISYILTTTGISATYAVGRKASCRSRRHAITLSRGARARTVLSVRLYAVLAAPGAGMLTEGSSLKLNYGTFHTSRRCG